MGFFKGGAADLLPGTGVVVGIPAAGLGFDGRGGLGLGGFSAMARARFLVIVRAEAGGRGDEKGGSEVTVCCLVAD